MQILDRLARIKRDANLDDDAVRQLDIQAEFNPDTHDELMEKIFEQGMKEEELESDGEDPKKPEFVDDYDALPLLSKTNALIKRKREMDICPDLEKDLQDYYSLDFEDVIGDDLYCRFKYREVEANDYGINLYEMLMNDPKDLNQIVGRKVLAPYREDQGRVRPDIIRNKMAAVETFQRFPDGPSAKVDKERLMSETALKGTKRKMVGAVANRKRRENEERKVKEHVVTNNS
eukprot:CAMPEP_0168518320 /NCGR_PEP_ID=MMETSP0405-20121227/6634_1 /TAXON_ID=498012 /ORGANISM="Trichosphaerium sp, Strain Am-I-7 wt" /LENGTH=231 /DNA_ID=CAMNT_0008538613 /DNA_START=124 /DNA_END=817 /DNA_ORIENTATION=-